MVLNWRRHSQTHKITVTQHHNNMRKTMKIKSEKKAEEKRCVVQQVANTLAIGAHNKLFKIHWICIGCNPVNMSFDIYVCYVQISNAHCVQVPCCICTVHAASTLNMKIEQKTILLALCKIYIDTKYTQYQPNPTLSRTNFAKHSRAVLYSVHTHIDFLLQQQNNNNKQRRKNINESVSPKNRSTNDNTEPTAQHAEVI